MQKQRYVSHSEIEPQEIDALDKGMSVFFYSTRAKCILHTSQFFYIFHAFYTNDAHSCRNLHLIIISIKWKNQDKECPVWLLAFTQKQSEGVSTWP